MAKEWTEVHQIAIENLEPKIDNARYQLECCGRKNTIINVTMQECHVLLLAVEKYKRWLREKSAAEKNNPLLEVHTSEPATRTLWGKD